MCSHLRHSRTERRGQDHDPRMHPRAPATRCRFDPDSRVGSPDGRSPSEIAGSAHSFRRRDKITARQALDLFGLFYTAPDPAAELLARFDLEEKADAPFATLSGGQRQRLFLALGDRQPPQAAGARRTDRRTGPAGALRVTGSDPGFSNRRPDGSAQYARP